MGRDLKLECMSMTFLYTIQLLLRSSKENTEVMLMFYVHIIMFPRGLNYDQIQKKLEFESHCILKMIILPSRESRL